MSHPTTLDQTMMLDYFVSFWRTHDRAPTLVEAAAHFGITPQGVQHRCKRLLAAGLLEIVNPPPAPRGRYVPTKKALRLIK